jgi:hypothetical protein
MNIKTQKSLFRNHKKIWNYYSEIIRKSETKTKKKNLKAETLIKPLLVNLNKSKTFIITYSYFYFTKIGIKHFYNYIVGLKNNINILI